MLRFPCRRLAELLGASIKPTADSTTQSRRIAAVERRMGIENAKQLGKVLAEMEEQNMHTAADYEKIIQNLGKKQMGLTNEISLSQEKKKGFADVAKSLLICKTYREIWLTYASLPIHQKSRFFNAHRTELQAYHSATAKLEKVSIDQTVEPDKVMALAEGIEHRIEELKMQVKEMKLREQKSRQEQKKVSDIQSNVENNRRHSEIDIL